MNDDRTYDHKIPDRVDMKKYLAFFREKCELSPANYLFSRQFSLFVNK